MRCRSVTFAWPWDGSGGGCLSAVARKPVYPGLRWSAEWLAGSRKLTFVTLILGSALALLPKARAGCSNAARPDPWRGLWATMIPTPTIVQYVQAFHSDSRRAIKSFNSPTPCSTQYLPWVSFRTDVSNLSGRTGKDFSLRRNDRLRSKANAEQLTFAQAAKA